MTIEIKQLIIRAVADGRREAAPAEGRVGAVTSPAPRSAREPEPAERDHEAIVAACVREVLRRLERARER
jgi:hypothetical protein